MHEELVERRRWVGESRFLHALNYCMLLPGPEATQLAIYVGWLLHGTAGGVAAGVFFVLPSVAILWGLSYVYVALGDVPWVAAAFHGVKPAVMAIVAVAVIRIGRKALKNEVMWVVAGLAFVAIFFLEVAFPLIILAAGVLGLLGSIWWRRKFAVLGAHGPAGAEERVLGDASEPPPHARPSRRRAVRVAAACLFLWWVPVLGVATGRGWDDTLAREGVFFSKAALVTFGGAYAVLPYVAQKAVEDYGWLGPGQMLDGLGLAETTPGPLIMVVQFVGFMGGWNDPAGLPPLVAATAGALITTWVTFVPCFLWILVGAPYIERLRGKERLTSALSTITAAVVGVVLNLAVWFGLHVLFPFDGRVEVFALVVAVVSFAGMLRWRWGIVPVVVGGAVAGVLHRALLQA